MYREPVKMSTFEGQIYSVLNEPRVLPRRMVTLPRRFTPIDNFDQGMVGLIVADMYSHKYRISASYLYGTMRVYTVEHMRGCKYLRAGYLRAEDIKRILDPESIEYKLYVEQLDTYRCIHLL